MLKRLALAGFVSIAATASNAAEIAVSLTIPSKQAAEYHRPYVAIWLENDNKKATHLALWYDVEMRNNKGQKWLKDLRQWWRRGGRKLELPADGISGATRQPGTYKLTFSDDSPALKDLPAGQYRLRVEASREVGGREVLNIPMSWPVEKAATLKAEGTDELGTVSLILTP